MKRLLQIAMAVALIAQALPVLAAEVAVLKNGFSMRHERRELIGDTTRLYLSASEQSGYIDVPTERIGSFEADDAPVAATADASAVEALASKPSSIEESIRAASEKHRIDQALIESVIHAESSFNPKAVSPKGARGLMQLMPGTAAQLGVNDAFDANANVEGGTRYLQQLLIRYNNLAKALAAYNAGPNRVEQYNGIPPYRETRTYVSRVITEFNRKKRAQMKIQRPPQAPAKTQPGAAAAAPQTAANPAASSSSSSTQR